MGKLKDKGTGYCSVKIWTAYSSILTMCILLWLAGCGDQVNLPSAQQLIEFENAGPRHPSFDIDDLAMADVSGGAYRVVPGDVLELTMPAVVRFIAAEEVDGSIEATKPYLCRVNKRGSIILPTVGDVKVAGKTLSEVESEVVDTYYPEYVLTSPSVFARVLEYKTAKVSITGAVQKPGIYSLRSDQMSLVALLMEAGGIVNEGAEVIRIVRRNQTVSDGKDAAPGTSEEAFEHTTGVDAAARLPSAARYPDVSGTEVRLAFRESAALGTTGKLTITQGQKLLFAEHMNITDPGERRLVLSKLECSEPGISVTEIDEKLCMLAALLQNRASTHGAGMNGISENSNSRAKSGDNSSVRSTLTKIVPEDGPQLSVPEVTQSLWLPVKPVQYNHAMSTGQNIDSGKDVNPSGTPSASNLASNMSMDEVFEKKALEPTAQDRDLSRERITGLAGAQRHQALALPVKGANIPFANVVLYDGDSVIVERLQLPLFSVLGLVTRPGNFPYPPDVRYNLMQALAFAGGLDRGTEPRYATIYRQNHDGTIISVVLEVVKVGDGRRLAEALKTEIKPGDIIAVEHTPRTHTKQFLDTVFRINVGTYWQLNDAWEN